MAAERLQPTARDEQENSQGEECRDRLSHGAASVGARRLSDKTAC
jgi:hypothetical protein